MVKVQLVIIPLIGAFIGWITNRIAVKMLFRPFRPRNLLGLQIQGLIPKRQGEIARLIGKIVQEELVNADEILALLKTKEITADLQKRAAEAIQFKVMAKVPRFLPMSMRAALAEIIKDVIHKEMPELLEEMLDGLERHVRDRLDLAGIVEKKINQMNLRELERLVLSIASSELKHIEYLGAVLGLIIGILQALISILS